MAHHDVFNGDVDGICALHQLRLACPADSQLITGVKRDITLLERVVAKPGDTITVFPMSAPACWPTVSCKAGITSGRWLAHSATAARRTTQGTSGGK